MGQAVNVEPEDLRRIMAALNKADSLVKQARSGVKSAQRSARWDDSQSRKFAAMVSTSDRNLAKFEADSEEMKKFLKSLIRIAEQYRGR